MDDPPPFNRYRTDIRYKDAFFKVLLFPPNRRQRSRKYRLQPPLGGDLAEQRKAAYDTVHCGVAPLRSEPDKESSYRAIDLWRRNREGRTQAQIAHEFGLHRQSVSRTLKRLESIERRHANEAQIDPVTREPFSLDGDKTWQLFEQVRRLRQQEKSTAQIAAKLDRFAWTIEALERWSDIADAVTRSLDEHSDLDHLAKRFRISVEAIAQIRGRLRQPAQGNVSTRITSSQAMERVIELLSKDSVSEVYIDQPFQLEIEDAGKRYKRDVAALTPTAISKLTRILTNRILLTEAYRTHPIRMGWLWPWGYRVTIVLPPAIQADRVRISVRKPEIPRAS